CRCNHPASPHRRTAPWATRAQIDAEPSAAMRHQSGLWHTGHRRWRLTRSQPVVALDSLKLMAPDLSSLDSDPRPFARPSGRTCARLHDGVELSGGALRLLGAGTSARAWALYRGGTVAREAVEESLECLD